MTNIELQDCNDLNNSITYDLNYNINHGKHNLDNLEQNNKKLKYERVIDNNIHNIYIYNKNKDKCASCFLGFIFGLVFNIFGLSCICCVNDKMWYCIGFIFPCLVTSVVICVFFGFIFLPIIIRLINHLLYIIF